MGYYYRRRYRRYGRSNQAAGRSTRLGDGTYTGIDDDVRQVFFSLDHATLTRIFDEYAFQYGDGKRKYAESTYWKWKRGEVRMGGEISHRLVRIVPRYLSFDHKYQLIHKLWNRLRRTATSSITISQDGGLAEAIATVQEVVAKAGQSVLPPTILERLEWLSGDDGLLAQSLLAEVDRREASIAAATTDTELRQLLGVIHQHGDKEAFARKTIVVPGHIIHIYIRQSTSTSPQTRCTMNTANDPANSHDNVPVHRPSSTASGGEQRELAPIQDPGDLLSEALRRMTPRQQEDVIGKATTEALRLQVKAQEGTIDHQMAAVKVDSVADAAQRLGQTGTQFEVKAEHRSEHGSMQVTVKNKPTSVSERMGGCFVATACYGDHEHPAVRVLRQFRDSVLSTSWFGRAFVRIYYRWSPRLADMIRHSPTLRLAGRIALWPVVTVAQFCLNAGRSAHH